MGSIDAVSVMCESFLCCSSSEKPGKPKNHRDKRPPVTGAERSTPSEPADEDIDDQGSEEEDYEREARSTNDPAQANTATDLLPFKTRDGELIYNKAKSAIRHLAVVRPPPLTSIAASNLPQ